MAKRKKNLLNSTVLVPVLRDGASEVEFVAEFVLENEVAKNTVHVVEVNTDMKGGILGILKNVEAELRQAEHETQGSDMHDSIRKIIDKLENAEVIQRIPLILLRHVEREVHISVSEDNAILLLEQI